ncbi:MAG: hypothetical protein ACFB0B_12580 [Thermonemataceae bacterium]
MKYTYLFFLLTQLYFFQVKAQSTPAYLQADFTLGVYEGGVSMALAGYRLHPVAFNGKLQLGYGLRFSNYFGSEVDYITAPADVTEGNLFTAPNDDRLDTLQLGNAQTNALNAAVYVVYTLTDRWGVGFNIDLIGVSFGADQAGVFTANSEGRSTTEVDASVSNFNLLLTGDYDRGSLNSELYVYYLLNDRWALRGGFTYLFSEYTTDQTLTFDNDRFRRKSLGGAVSLAYRF